MICVIATYTDEERPLSILPAVNGQKKVTTHI